jgi:broad specificity phosphatase PhoE
MTKIIISVAIISVLGFSSAKAQQAVFLVRHGEDVRSKESPDRLLTEAGHQRAALLARLLKDTGINVVFTSTLQRTIDTAAPLAKALNLEPQPLPQLTTKFEQKDMEEFAALLRSKHASDIVLFVGHSNTVPALLKALGHSTEIKIPETEYDNLFVLIPKSGGPPTVLRLRY